jgi:hypothetical protein
MKKFEESRSYSNHETTIMKSNKDPHQEKMKPSTLEELLGLKKRCRNQYIARSEAID